MFRNCRTVLSNSCNVQSKTKLWSREAKNLLARNKQKPLNKSLVKYSEPKVKKSEKRDIIPNENLPSRKQQLQSLTCDQFDVLIIGGGATGAGCALDSVTRGLKTAMVEMNDFSSGTLHHTQTTFS